MPNVTLHCFNCRRVMCVYTMICFHEQYCVILLSRKCTRFRCRILFVVLGNHSHLWRYSLLGTWQNVHPGFVLSEVFDCLQMPFCFPVVYMFHYFLNPGFSFGRGNTFWVTELNASHAQLYA